jgi:glycosyltransferase involved in cell wall biosynthesis
MEEAIESVLAQTYRYWELLLVDDGSTDESTALAKRYAAQNRDGVHYFEHSGHENRGISASRMLGIAEASGQYVAFLDADDLWLPCKLEEQVALLNAHSEAVMIYGNTQYWHSWRGDSHYRNRDFVPRLGVEGGTVRQPPTLLPLYLRGEATEPRSSNIMVRRGVFHSIGGFEAAFRDMYEDQVFYSKVCLAAPVFVADACWDRYRQHPDSICAVAEQKGLSDTTRLRYLRWLEQYLLSQHINDRSVWKALREELRYYDDSVWSGHVALARYVRRRVRKLLRRIRSD